MTLIAHMADLHLGYRQYGIVEREEDLYQTFEEAIDEILSERAKIVLISGDFFNSPRPPIRALYHLKLNLEKLKSQGIKIICILGDHDLPRRTGEYSPIVLFKDDYLCHVNEKTLSLEVDGQHINISGMDRIPPIASDEARAILETLSSDIRSKKGKRILMSHLPFTGISGELCVNDLPEDYDYYALGHEHIRNIAQKGRGIVAYPGSIDILAIDEVQGWKAEGKGFYLVDLSGSEPLIHKVNLKTIRPQEIFEISLKESLENIFNWIVAQSKKPIIHLIIKDREFDLRAVHELVDKLRELGCLDVRYRKKISENVLTSRPFTQLEISHLNVKELIREIASDEGLSEDEVKLALQVYDEFRKGGKEALKDLLLRKVSEVMQIDNQRA
ncbi:MAG: exonuclease SbcCD subunit D [Nitrososphaerota archaeon]